MLAEFMNGGLSYDAATVMARTSERQLLVIGACALSFVGAYMQYFGAIRNGFRHQTFSIPLIGNLWNFAHDTTYVSNFHHWFYEVDFWMVKAFWFALAIFALCEMVVMVQLIRWGHREVFPGLSRPQAITAYVGLQLFTYGLFWWFLSMIEDPFYLLSFCTTVVVAPMFNIGLMRSRGTQKGFSMTMLVGYSLLSIGFWLWMLLIDPYFQLPFMWMVALGNTAIAVAGIFVFRKLPPYTPATAAQGG